MWGVVVSVLGHLVDFVFPIILFLFGIGLVRFFSKDEQRKKSGKKLLIWALALFVITLVFTLIQYLLFPKMIKFSL